MDGLQRFMSKTANCDTIKSWPGDCFHGEKKSSHLFSHVQEGKCNSLAGHSSTGFIAPMQLTSLFPVRECKGVKPQSVF